MTSRRAFLSGLTVLTFAPVTIAHSEPYGAEGKAEIEQYVHVYGKIGMSSALIHSQNLQKLQQALDTEVEAMKRDFMKAMRSQQHLKENVLPYAYSKP